MVDEFAEVEAARERMSAGRAHGLVGDWNRRFGDVERADMDEREDVLDQSAHVAGDFGCLSAVGEFVDGGKETNDFADPDCWIEEEEVDFAHCGAGEARVTEARRVAVNGGLVASAVKIVGNRADDLRVA